MLYTCLGMGTRRRRQQAHDMGVLSSALGRAIASPVSYTCMRRWIYTSAKRERWIEGWAATAAGSAPDMLSSHHTSDARAKHSNRVLLRLGGVGTIDCMSGMACSSQSPRSRLDVEPRPSVVTWWSAYARPRNSAAHHGRVLPLASSSHAHAPCPMRREYGGDGGVSYEKGTSSLPLPPLDANASTVYARIHPSIVTWSIFVAPSARLGAQSSGAGVVERRERKEIDERDAQTSEHFVNPAPLGQLLGSAASAQRVYSDSGTEGNMSGNGCERLACAPSGVRQASPSSTSSSISSPSLVTLLCVPLVLMEPVLEPVSRCVCLILH